MRDERQHSSTNLSGPHWWLPDILWRSNYCLLLQLNIWKYFAVWLSGLWRENINHFISLLSNYKLIVSLNNNKHIVNFTTLNVWEVRVRNFQHWIEDLTSIVLIIYDRDLLVNITVRYYNEFILMFTFLYYLTTQQSNY